NFSAISLRSNRSPVRNLPVSSRFTTWATTWSFSLTPYFLGIVRELCHVRRTLRTGATPDPPNPKFPTQAILTLLGLPLAGGPFVAPLAQGLSGGQVVVGAV